MLNKKTVDDLTNLQGKKVLVRCDFNVPLKDGVIQNYNRIDGAIPTIKKLLDQGARVILCSHLGKPKGEPVPEMSLAPVAPALKERLGVEVKFVDDPKVTGEETKKVAAELKDGEVLLLQNTRYRGEETKYGKDEKADAYAKELAELCDCGVFVNDAFWYCPQGSLLQCRRDKVHQGECGRLSDGEGDQVLRSGCGEPGSSFRCHLRRRQGF